jgi:hypothetical protein
MLKFAIPVYVQNRETQSGGEDVTTVRTGTEYSVTYFVTSKEEQ